MKYTFYANDGSSIISIVVGEGMDSADKSANKALSVAYKYACFQVFCIPTEEMKDPDADAPDPAPKPKAQPKQEQPKAPPAEQPKSDAKINGVQSTAIFTAAKALWGDEAQAKLIDTFKIDSLKNVTVAQYEPMMAKLERLKNGTNLG